MQHGEATTEAGRTAVGRMAERARAAGVRLDLCVHSGKLRPGRRRGTTSAPPTEPTATRCCAFPPTRRWTTC
jgi:hypothetical protein